MTESAQHGGRGIVAAFGIQAHEVRSESLAGGWREPAVNLRKEQPFFALGVGAKEGDELARDGQEVLAVVIRPLFDLERGVPERAHQVALEVVVAPDARHRNAVPIHPRSHQSRQEQRFFLVVVAEIDVFAKKTHESLEIGARWVFPCLHAVDVLFERVHGIGDQAVLAHQMLDGIHWTPAVTSDVPAHLLAETWRLAQCLRAAGRRRKHFAPARGKAWIVDWHAECSPADMEPSTTLHAKPYVIIVGVDFSDIGDLAVQRAFELAAQQAHAEVHLVHVARSFGPTMQIDLPQEVKTLSAEEASDELVRYTERKVEEFAAKHAADGCGGFARAVTHLRLESPAAEIAQLASDLEADIAIVGTHGRRGFSRVLLGSVAEAVVRLAPCPVLVVRAVRVTATDVPTIEPPCPRCVETRRETAGQELWCAQHRQRHGRRHTYHQVDRKTSSHPPTGLLTELS